MKTKLKIVLRSDLCAAVGKNYAAVIDLDTALDEYGIPFIPSRRLKGCLREVAEYFMSDSQLDAIFGKTGEISGSLKMGDAFIEDYANVVSSVKANDEATPVNVTKLFCTVRGQTAIEGDTAKENSLRYIRVINKNKPGSELPLAFYADIEFDDNYKDSVEKAVKGLRNIGYHRDRGLGAVICSLENPTAGNKMTFSAETFDDEKEYSLRLTVRLDNDLMLPGSDANHSVDYISGTQLLGAVAGKYIGEFGDSDFNEYFYSDDVSFGNLYPALKTDGGFEYTHPAYRYLAKVKSATRDEEKNFLFNLSNLDNESNKNGLQFKPLKRDYISDKYGLVEVDRKIVYHNSNVKSKENDQLLYMQYCICSGQYFSGEITGKGKKLATIYSLLCDGSVSFGRSKSAQYASCSVVELKKNEKSVKPVNLKNGQTAAFVLESDVALADENGVYSASARSLCDALGVDFDKIGKASAVTVKTISGYNSKWNLKKPQFTVFSAGSCIIFKREDLKKDSPNEYFSVGAKINEGYGRIRLIENVSASEKVAKNGFTPCSQSANTKSYVSDLIKDNIYFERVTEIALGDAEKIRLEASQTGRLTLMAKDADKESPSYEDIKNVVENIKDDDLKKRAEKIIENIPVDNGSYSLESFLIRIESIKTEKTRKLAQQVFSKKTLIESMRDADIPFEWKYIYRYIITVLTVRKYNLRNGKETNK